MYLTWAFILQICDHSRPTGERETFIDTSPAAMHAPSQRLCPSRDDERGQAHSVGRSYPQTHGPAAGFYGVVVHTFE